MGQRQQKTGKNKKTYTANTRNNISQKRKQKGGKPNARMGKKSESMEHQRRMGKNATTYKRKEPNTKTNNKMDQTIRRQQQKITLTKIMIAWKQADANGQ